MALILAGATGTNILWGLLGLLATSLKNIYHFSDNIVKSENKYVTEQIANIDLSFSISIVKKIMQEIKMEKMTYVVSVCIEEIYDTIKNIELELNYVDNKMRYNKSLLLFKTFRSCKFGNSIERLINMKNVLDSRTNLLFTILNVNQQMK